MNKTDVYNKFKNVSRIIPLNEMLSYNINIIDESEIDEVREGFYTRFYTIGSCCTIDKYKDVLLCTVYDDGNFYHAANTDLETICSFDVSDLSTDKFNVFTSYKPIIKTETPQETKEINTVYEEIKPNHYNFTLTNKKGESIECDVFDIANAMNLSREQTVALRYFRVKGDTNKQINDTEKCIHTLKRYIDKLKIKVNNE